MAPDFYDCESINLECCKSNKIDDILNFDSTKCVKMRKKYGFAFKKGSILGKLRGFYGLINYSSTMITKVNSQISVDSK